MGLTRALCIAATGFVVVSSSGEGQALHGTVRDSASRQPISGAVVTLLGVSGNVIGRSITSAGGAYVMTLSTGVQRMRLQRIGFRPRELNVVPAVPTAAGFDVAMERLPTFLEPMRVAAGACPQRADRGSAIALLEQARNGLLAIVVARDANAASVVRLSYRKAMDGNSDRIRRMSVQMDTVDRTANPFHAVLPGRDFARRGFVSGEGAEKTYFGPDPEVVLDDEFIAAYCFRVLEPDRRRPNQVGLGFAPADRKRDRIDIDGALWIDTVARALHEIEFRYLGFDRSVDALHPGGRVSFREMPNGVVFIDRWSLRLVGAEEDTIPGGVRRDPTIRQWLYAQESGGELARAEWPEGRTWTASLGTLRVHAVTHAGLPAVGTVVRLPETPYGAIADAQGNFTIPNLVPGPYSLIVADPRLAEIGVVLETPIAFVAARDSVVERTLDVPTAEDYGRARCEADRHRIVDDSTYIVGRVVSRDGTPLSGVKVTVQAEVSIDKWRDLPDSYRTGTNGLFHFCPGVLRDHPKVRITATRDQSAPVAMVVKLDGRLVAVRVPFEP